MPQPCKICGHTDRVSIDAAILANRSGLRAIAAQFGVSKSSLARHFHSHIEPGQDALPQRIGEPQQVSEPGQASEPQSTTPHYDAFIRRFHGGKRISMTEVRGWGYPVDVLQDLIETAIQCGDLSRRSEP